MKTTKEFNRARRNRELKRAREENLKFCRLVVSGAIATSQKNLEFAKAALQKERDRVRQCRINIGIPVRVRPTESEKKERVREAVRRWQRKNAPILAANSRYRLFRMKNQTPDNACKKMILTFYRQSSRLSKCMGIPHEVDHIIPVSKGGLHHQSNLQVLPWMINRRKRDKIPY